MRHEIAIPVDDGVLACGHHRAGSDDLLSGQGRPCVVMAHGLGGLRDSVLRNYAERFAAAGADVLLFDYRGFGGSSGAPRDDVSHQRQRQDYRTVVAHARTLPGVDPDRIVVWGTSYSGGHVITVAADDPRIAAVIAQGAAMDGLAATMLKRRLEGTVPVSRLVGRAVLDTLGLTRWVPVAAPPGELAALTTPDSDDGYRQVAGETASNRMRARGILRLPLNRPVRQAHRVTAPLLLQTAEHDSIAPVAAMEKVARRAGGEVRLLRYDAGHFDLYLGSCFEEVVGAQVAFLREVLSP